MKKENPLKSPSENLPARPVSVSLQEIAQYCKVSPMTVSRALRNLPSVTEKTREKVLEAAAFLGYLPSSRAGRKAQKFESWHKKPVQLIAGDAPFGMPRFHAELILALVRMLAVKKYECIVRVSNGDYREFTSLLHSARNAKVEASIIVGTFAPGLRSSLLSALPGAILIDDTENASYEATYSSFSFDNAKGAALAVDHLLRKGRKKILLVTGPKNHFFSRETERGYRLAHSHHKVEVDERMILETDFSPGSALEKMDSLFREGIPFDAVFTNDEMAGSVYRSILARGLKIPEDIAVCGCDNLPLCEQLYPRLSTVVLDYKTLAREAVESIVRGNLTLTPCEIKLLPKLLLRESC